MFWHMRKRTILALDNEGNDPLSAPQRAKNKPEMATDQVMVPVATPAGGNEGSVKGKRRRQCECYSYIS